MGKKGNWFSAIKKAFTGSSKEKPVIAHVERTDARDKKKWAFGKPKNGEISTFIPLCREPSSIEKILGDADKDSEEPYKRHRPRPPQRRSVENEIAQYQSRYRRTIEHDQTDPYHNRRAVDVYNHGDPYHDMVHQVPSTRLHHVQQVDQNRLPQGAGNRYEDQHRELEQKRAHQVRHQKAQNESDLYQRENNAAHRKPQMVQIRKPKISPNVSHESALKIQSAFRGYLARRNYRALRGLIRLQTMMRGNGIKRQTTEAMKCMQLLVKVQTQIHARRVEMMESRASQPYRTSESDGIFGRSSTQTDSSWNDSVLTKEEAEARMRKKVEAVMKRERALAYAYSHQLLKATPATATVILADLHAGASQWSWTPFDRHPPVESNVKPKIKFPAQIQHEFSMPLNRQSPDVSYTKPKIKHPIQTQIEFNTPLDHDLNRPAESYSKQKIKYPIQTQHEFNSPLRQFSSPQQKLKINHPIQTQVEFNSPLRQFSSPQQKPKINHPIQTQLEFSSPLRQFSSPKPNQIKPKAKPNQIIRDDDSLTSCPPFTVPNYMAPTVAAKAKVKPRVQEKHEEKRRFSFGIGQGIKWGKGSFWKDTAPSERISNAPSEVSRRHRSTLSIGSAISIDSAVSMPVVVGRRPFR